MKEFLRGISEGAATAFLIVTIGMMVSAPTIIVAYFAFEKHSWLLGVLAFAVFIMTVSVAGTVYERLADK